MRTDREGEMHRHRRIRHADLKLHAVIGDQQRELLGEIGAEQIRPRDGGDIASRRGERAKGEAAVERGEGVNRRRNIRIKARTRRSGMRPLAKLRKCRSDARRASRYNCSSASTAAFCGLVKGGSGRAG